MYVKSASDAWLRSHLGKLTIYDILSIVSRSLSDELTLTNIKPGFLVKVIWPLNIDVFTDEYVSPSAGSNRPRQDNKDLENSEFPDSSTSDSNFNASSQPSRRRKKINSVAFSPQANYTDRAIAACRRS
jgi:hypothetical protein